MDIQKTIERLQFFTEMCGVAMQHDLKIMNRLTATFERRYIPRKKNTDSEVAKKGPKNLLTAAASVQAVAV